MQGWCSGTDRNGAGELAGVCGGRATAVSGHILSVE